LPRFTHHLHITARGMGRHQRLAGKSGGRLLRWRRPCVPWRVRPAHRHAHGWRAAPRPASTADALYDGDLPRTGGRRFCAHRQRAAAAPRLATRLRLWLWGGPLLLPAGLCVLWYDRHGSSGAGGAGRPAGFSLQGSRAPNQYHGLDVTDVLSPSWRAVRPHLQRQHVGHTDHDGVMDSA